MPYKDPEKRREVLRKWRAANREKTRMQQQSERGPKNAAGRGTPAPRRQSECDPVESLSARYLLSAEK
jgi:hypothetical protein